MTNSEAGYVPPHNLEAEQSVLGGLMLRQDAYHDLSLTVRDFYSRTHQIVFGAISSLVAARQPVDIMTVTDRVRADGFLDDIGGMAYLIEIAKNTPSAANITNYGAIVRQTSERRFAISKLHDCISAMVDAGYASCDDRFAAMGSMLSEIDAKRAGGISGIAAPASDIVIEFCDELERRLNRRPGELSGFATGIPSLDELLYPGGISQTALICIGARPKMGKTTLMAAMLNHVALTKRLPLVGFSLEMTKRELFEVMVSQASGVSGQALKSMQDQSKMDLAYAVAAELGNSKLHLADQPGMGLHQIVRESRRLRRELGQLGVIAVDYLTLMKAEKAERNDLAYGAITKGLKELAKEMGCPVILLTQLNRGLESRADKRPMPSDSRDTGQIEQDCDIWIGCYRDEVYNEDSPTRGLMELLVRIHRGGRTGTAYCGFHEGVITRIDQQEVERKMHLSEMQQSTKHAGGKGGWNG